MIWLNGEGKTWLGALLVSVGLHGLILGVAWHLQSFSPPVKRVVPVEAITLADFRPGWPGKSGGHAAVKKPEVTPPPPAAKKDKPKPPKKSKPRIIPRPFLPETTNVPAIQTAAVPPAPSKATSGLEGATGRGTLGSGSGGGAGSGLGSGTGAGGGSGMGSGGGSPVKAYLQEVYRRLSAHKDYPPMARRQHQQGVVMLRFTISASGQVAGSAITRSSGFNLLDQAALETLKKVGRFPPFPPGMTMSQLTIEVPLAFRLTEG